MEFYTYQIEDKFSTALVVEQEKTHTLNDSFHLCYNRVGEATITEGRRVTALIKTAKIKRFLLG